MIDIDEKDIRAVARSRYQRASRRVVWRFCLVVSGLLAGFAALSMVSELVSAILVVLLLVVVAIATLRYDRAGSKAADALVEEWKKQGAATRLAETFKEAAK